MTLPDRSPAQPKGKGAGLCATFQPLCNRLSAENGDDRQKSVESEEAILAQAREKGWKEGMTSGRQEACRMAREGLSPGISSFFSAWHELVRSNEHCETKTADAIVSLAFAIVHQILGEDTSLSERELAPLKAVLVQKISSANQLVLKMNPDDLASLQALAKADQIAWPDHSAVIIQPDETLIPGAVEIAGHKKQNDRALMDNSIVKDVMALLAEQDLLPA